MEIPSCMLCEVGRYQRYVLLNKLYMARNKVIGLEFTSSTNFRAHMIFPHVVGIPLSFEKNDSCLECDYHDVCG